MTIAAAFVPRKFDLPAAEERLFQVDPESRILGRCHWQPGKRRDAPVIVIVHGLEGSSDSNYVRGIAEKAYRAGLSRGAAEPAELRRHGVANADAV